jgi:hypothetical protein
MNEQPVIKLELPLHYVNTIMASLGKAPYEAVADVVQAIREQAVPQLKVPDVSVEPNENQAS